MKTDRAELKTGCHNDLILLPCATIEFLEKRAVDKLKTAKHEPQTGEASPNIVSRFKRSWQIH